MEAAKTKTPAMKQQQQWRRSNSIEPAVRQTVPAAAVADAAAIADEDDDDGDDDDGDDAVRIKKTSHL